MRVEHIYSLLSPHISDKYSMFLFEVFDRPYELLTGTSRTRKIANWLASRNSNINSVRVYEVVDDPRNIFIEFRGPGGYWEVHHALWTGSGYVSGKKLKLSAGAATQYIATLIQLYKQHLDRGRAIRIVATRDSDMWSTYKRVMARLVRGAEDSYDVSEPQEYTSVDGVPSTAVTIELRNTGLLKDYSA